MAEPTEAQQQARKLWSSGDYPTAMRVIASVGRSVVETASVVGDDVVLDVACGSGNATIPAAKTGAKTTGLDITPELLEAGKKAAPRLASRSTGSWATPRIFHSTTRASTSSHRCSAACSPPTTAGPPRSWFES